MRRHRRHFPKLWIRLRRMSRTGMRWMRVIMRRRERRTTITLRCNRERIKHEQISHSTESLSYFFCAIIVSKAVILLNKNKHLKYYQLLRKVYTDKLSFSLCDSLGTPSKKPPSYSVTLSLKVGVGQDEIILLGAAKIVTRW